MREERRKALTCPGAARLVGTSKQRGKERGGKGNCQRGSWTEPSWKPHQEEEGDDSIVSVTWGAVWVTR